jgi:hypothetical protein
MSIAVGFVAIAYAHVIVAPYLQRSVDVARRLVDDGLATTIALSETAASADALRAPGEQVVRRSVATLQPSIAVFEAVADTLRVVPGATGDRDAAASDGPPPAAGLPGSVRKLRRAIDGLVGEAEHVRTAALALEAEKRRHRVPSMQPALAAAGARLRETQAILADTNPARGMTMLADLIAGLYLFLGGALIATGRAISQ